MNSEMLQKAIAEVLRALEQRPEKNMLNAYAAINSGKRPAHAPLSIYRVFDPSLEPPKKQLPPPCNEEEKLAREVQAILEPLKKNNMFTPSLSLGLGCVTCALPFGIVSDPEIAGCLPHESIPLAHFDGFKLDDPAETGMMPEMRKRIQLIKQLLPSYIKIGLPDMQGPFNTAHTILGSTIFEAIYEQPDAVLKFMDLVAQSYIDMHQLLCEWIGPERMIDFVGTSRRIAECSCNQISRDDYVNFVLPADLKVATYLKTVGIHPCSGPHVFEETLELLPNVIYSEAGFIDKAAAGAISVEQAFELTEDRKNFCLSIGQELPLGKEEEMIRSDIARSIEHPFLLFNYTGMHWTPADESQMLDIHKRMDDFYYSIV